MDQKLMREFVEKKLKRGGYTNIAAANFPCGVYEAVCSLSVR